MKSLAVAFALISPLLNFVLAQVTTTPLQPTKLEAFAAKSTAQVKWSKEVGRIDEGETQAIVTALIIEDATQFPYRMRGLRIDLNNINGVDQIYLDETALVAVRNALEEIESGVDSFLKERDKTPYRYRGAAEFWRPNDRIHTLNAAYFIRPDSSGLSLSAYKNQEFRFPGHRPGELAALITRAIRELNQR
jgi:hypothetical protein